MSYYTKRRVEGEFDAVLDRVRDALAEEGFGVLADIDVRATFAEKLGVEDFRRYRILGACNPALANEGLAADVDLGTLLPCNVVVYEDGGDVVVSLVDPEVLLSPADDPALDPIAADVADRFDRVLEAVTRA